MELLRIFGVSALSLLVLFLLTKLMGYKEISQLSLFDYIVGISIGSVAAEMATNLEAKWWYGVTAMCIYAGAEILISFLSQKSGAARKVIEGEPIVLVREGKLYKKAMKKARIETDDLLSAARSAGYFNLADIDCAVMETSGKISFLPLPLKRPLNAKDFNFAPLREGLCFTVVEDGAVQPEELRKAQFTEEKLLAFLSERGYALENILLATINESGRVDVFER